MLPVEGVFFIPSLFITPLAVAGLLFYRKRQSYPRVWRYAVIACLVLTALYTVVTLSTPFYSERDHSSDNPGGPSSGVFAVIGVFLIGTCVVIPAFPVLIALAALPPRGWPRIPLVVLSLLFMAVLAFLIVRKNAAYVADYEQARQQERIERIQWRQQRIRP